MAGDPAQLPPTVTSREAQQQHALTLTLFERLQTTLGLEPLLLDTQYRMHPAISHFPRYALVSDQAGCWVRQVNGAGSSPTLVVLLECLCMGHHNASRLGKGAMFALFAPSCAMSHGSPAPHPTSALTQAPPPTHAPLLLPAASGFMAASCRMV